MIVHELSSLFQRVKKQRPLIVHYTNEVTINDCANITLACGASPLMSYNDAELEDIMDIADAVVINIGTMNTARLPLFFEAGKAANAFGKPIILDPVGVFASKERMNFTEKLLQEIQFAVIKGNMAEIQALSGMQAEGKGVDADESGKMDAKELMKLASSLRTVIAATGKEDIIGDYSRVALVKNGTPALKAVTGTGCMTASLIASCSAVADDYLMGASAGVLAMSLCGELADRDGSGTGTFRVKLMDEMYRLVPEVIGQKGKVEWKEW
ncbi:hydroxyethylthiazole kinase [Bacillus sp. 1P06AnD]|uniref:hydroxyethylthiazole kinase n=1 Tax=Bacillus sp. 1P06AnD TaxID=3132208 RepID=UPI0039A3CC65